MEDNIFYVYAYLDPRKEVKKSYLGFEFNYEPFYIGKGNGDRDLSHFDELRKVNNRIEKGEIAKNNVHRKIHKLNNIIAAKKNPIVVRLKESMSELDAFDLENKLIESIGRVEDGGVLFNYRTGGWGGGRLGEESKERVSKSLKEYFKENDVWNKGKTGVYTEEQRKQISDSLRGKVQPQETIDRRSKSLKKQWQENKEEKWEKMKNTMEARGYVRDGVEIGKRISEAKKGKVVISEEQKKQNSETLKRKYENGEIIHWSKLEKNKERLEICKQVSSKMHKGKKVSKEVIEKQKKTFKENYESGRIKHWASIKIGQYDKNYNLVQTFDTKRSCFTKMKMDPSTLDKYLTIDKQYKGFYYKLINS